MPKTIRDLAKLHSQPVQKWTPDRLKITSNRWQCPDGTVLESTPENSLVTKIVEGRLFAVSGNLEKIEITGFQVEDFCGELNK